MHHKLLGFDNRKSWTEFAVIYTVLSLVKMLIIKYIISNTKITYSKKNSDASKELIKLCKIR